MTELELQVAEVIFALERTYDHRPLVERTTSFSTWIAPRVAAAIRASYEDGYGQGRADADAEAHDDEAVGPDSDSKAGLAALRGEPA